MLSNTSIIPVLWPDKGLTPVMDGFLLLNLDVLARRAKSLDYFCQLSEEVVGMLIAPCVDSGVIQCDTAAEY